ncbi:MAG: transporter substrate-binding domain-containing protein [Desulfarculus sp.]|nr:transporter substrate-binding domain-containing protein [Desulfarculus sp.]
MDGGGRPAWAATPLAIYYFPRPPYYTTEADGQAGGILVERVRAVLTQAGIDHRFVAVPNKRVLLLLSQGAAACGVGWLRTRQREAMFRFSLPIHRDQPLVALARAAVLPRLSARPTLAELLGSDLVLGVIDGFSYGEAVDQMISRANPARQVVTGEVLRLLQMTAAGRCDWMLINPLEARWQLGRDPDLARALRALELPDAPSSNPRHLMCSQSVAPEVMERIDQAILRMEGEPSTTIPGAP